MKIFHHIKNIWKLITTILSVLCVITWFMGGLLAFFVEGNIGPKLLFSSIILFTLSMSYDVVYYEEWSMPRRVVNLLLFCGGIFIIIVVCWVFS